MVSFLRTTLCLLVGLVQVSRAVHFTNTEWDVVENETVTFNWKYDSDDTRDPDTYVIVIWLPFGNEVYPWSGNYSHLLYNASYDADVTSYTWNYNCDFNLTTGDQYFFTIGGEDSGVLISMHDSTAWTLQAGDTPCYPTTKDNSLSKSAKAGIEAGSIVAGVIVLVAVGILLWRWRKKKNAAKQPASTVELIKQ
ncbi:hypothetical protein E8E14_011996 [Neopestalotiopsis sp. 37M]|nr:hypothetical protein E8E14_011996 [Neopestalotiopsis sp. 37M]